MCCLIVATVMFGSIAMSCNRYDRAEALLAKAIWLGIAFAWVMTLAR